MGKSKPSILIPVILLVLTFNTAHSKRLAPVEVPPVHYEGVEYLVIHWGYLNKTPQNGVYVEARNLDTNVKLWEVQVYVTEYNENLESDVQDVFIKSIRIDVSNRKLLIENENGDKFSLNIDTLEVQRITNGF